MVNTKLEEQLKEYQNLLPNQISNSTRSKLNETYQMIRETNNSTSPIQRETNVSRTFAKWGISTAAAAILGVTVMASGFVSPVMADALKQIPVLGQIYSLWGDKNDDPGIQQAEDFITNVNQSVTHGKLTMNIPTLLFDGTRILMNITTPGNRLASEPNSPPSDANKGAVDKLEVLYKGQTLASGYEFMDGETASSLIAEVSNTYAMKSSTQAQFPDQFDLTVNVTLKGYDDPFQFVLPITKSTPATVLTSEETKHHDNINLQISKLEITPITTQVSVEYKTKKGQSVEEMLASIPAKYKNETRGGSIIALQYDIVDEHGVQLKPIGTHPVSESYSIRFEPFKTLPSTVTIKPYLVISEEYPAGAEGRVEATHKVKEYIPELETVFSVK
ncbi:DUF4179 domain-containing protein [Paenibacillus pini]|uniref:DUF4179 domain-containing protein n=1 Tax=Paenibacillus pini JCM 16418 TaxID=1236976 RepID=W7YIL8_9BACL|nr:DUF4179 domain-containing protein [Paenibacillus pini]GAF08297.1 hypothetical protein JCM16418_2366 [Paenibacillus pini JCM 16418]